MLYFNGIDANPNYTLPKIQTCRPEGTGKTDLVCVFQQGVLLSDRTTGDKHLALTERRLSANSCFRSQHVQILTYFTMIQSYYKDYHTMANKNKISIKFNPEERALLELGMSQEGWSNVSGYIKSRLFGLNKTKEKKNALIRKKDKIGIVTLLHNYLKSFVDYTNFAAIAFKKEIAKLDASQPSNDADAFKKRIRVIGKWVHSVDKRINTVLTLLIMIRDSLGLPAGQSMKQEKEYKLGLQYAILTGKVTAVGEPFQLDDVNASEGIKFILNTQNGQEITNLTQFICIANKPTFEIRTGDPLKVHGILKLARQNDAKESSIKAKVYCKSVERITVKEERD